jgi:hypothetical protein
MTGPRSLLLLPLALVLTGPQAAAWAPQTRLQMIVEAVRLMPASLRTALEAHAEQVQRGMLEPMTGEDGADHRPSATGGGLDARLVSEAEKLEQSLRQPGSFRELAFQFGTSAHYVADAGFPPGVGEGGGERRYAHFAAFCETRREKFPLVFYGHEDDALDRGDYAAFAARLTRAAAQDDRELARAYAAAGEPPDPAAFDDRSVPFAIGSLNYSRTVTHVARLWLAAWRAAGGDLGRIPYWPDRSGTD